jgi:RNA-directed DNA polymerase
MRLQTSGAIRTLQRKLYGSEERAKLPVLPALRQDLRPVDSLRGSTLHHIRTGPSQSRRPRTFEQIEAVGQEDWLGRLGEELRGKTYRCQPVRWVMIPKTGGGERPFGIPTIRDCVVQTAAKLVLEPIPRVRLRRPEGKLRVGNGPSGIRLSAETQCVRCDPGGIGAASAGA